MAGCETDWVQVEETESLLAEGNDGRLNDYNAITRGSRRSVRGGSRTSSNLSYLGIRFNDSVELARNIDNPTTIALADCEKKILRPYLILQTVIGWLPIFDHDDLWWQKTINYFYTGLVCAFIMAAYIIQFATCFRRDSTEFVVKAPTTISVIMTAASNTTTEAPSTGLLTCQTYIISQYLIPDFLHSFAYFYSLIIIRYYHGEQLPTLMQRVFLQSSPTQSGYLSQRKLIRTLRILLGLALTWVFLSLIAQILHIWARYEKLKFSWLDPGSTVGEIMLLVLMCLGFFTLDLVYSVIVINYSVHCALLIFYVKGLLEKVREHSMKLQKAMQEMNEASSHAQHLNDHPASALSIVMFNFVTMALTGMVTFLDPNEKTQSWCIYLTTFLSITLWLSIMVLPLIQAARLTAAFSSLRKIGHTIKPFGYQGETNEELTSFMVFTSTLRLRAKIFFIPITAALLCGLFMVLCVTLVILFRLGTFHIWL